MTATHGDVNIIAIEKVIPENMGITVGILILHAKFFSFFRPFSSRHIGNTSGDIYKAFLAHIYSRNVIKAFATILTGFRASG